MSRISILKTKLRREESEVVSATNRLNLLAPGGESGISGTHRLGHVPQNGISGTHRLGHVPQNGISGTHQLGYVPQNGISGTYIVRTYSPIY